MAVLSKGIQLSYKQGSGSTYTALTNLQEIPELGGDADAIEITTLADAAHRYTDGLLSYGDSLAFKFLYDQEQFATLDGLTGEIDWKVELPDGEDGALDTAATFSGKARVKLDGVGTNAVLTYTLNIKPSTEITFG